MAQDLKTKSAFAGFVGVSVARITKLTKRGERLAPAMAGRFIDAMHPACLAYLAEREANPERRGGPKPGTPKTPGGNTDPTKRASGQAALREKKKYASTPDIPVDMFERLPPDIQAVGDMSLRDLVGIFGTDTRFKDWLDSLKKIEEIDDKRIKNKKSVGDLVEKGIVKKGVIDPFDRAHRLILTDGVRSMSKRLEAKFKAGASAVEAEKYMRDSISKILQPARKNISDTLRKNL